MSDLVTVDDLAYDQIDYSSTPTLFWNSINLPDDPNVWNGGVNAATAEGLSVQFSFTGTSLLPRIHCSIISQDSQDRKYLSMVALSLPPTARNSHCRCIASVPRGCKPLFPKT